MKVDAIRVRGAKRIAVGERERERKEGRGARVKCE
jgi:hypothetical protein